MAFRIDVGEQAIVVNLFSVTRYAWSGGPFHLYDLAVAS